MPSKTQLMSAVTSIAVLALLMRIPQARSLILNG